MSPGAVHRGIGFLYGKDGIHHYSQRPKDPFHPAFARRGSGGPGAQSDAELEKLACHAKEVLPEITAHFAPLVGVDYGRITIRAQRTRWGSCSAQGNLNFNCLLMLTPDDVMEYVVVHELCHRKEMNHSARFWAEVERVLPGYRESRRWLKEQGGGLIGRL